jgi:hemerythrin
MKMALKLKSSAIETLKQKNQQKSRHKILVVDDEEANLRALVSTLENDYEILTATDGSEALELIKSLDKPQDIHLIISDQRMSQMNGVEFLKQTIPLIPNTIRIILTGFTDVEDIISSINEGQIYRFMTKPTEPSDLRVVVKLALETYELREALQAALKNLQLTKITNGVYWLQIPEADLYILCGCPADIVKHMMQKGLIAQTQKGGAHFETGPNAILLSDSLIQKGEFSNLAEFPVLQMLYRQGMIIPNHPNNKGTRPLLIGKEQQVKAQMDYIYRGNYGLT